MKHLIGYGQLNWDGSERRSDRYGAVRLYHDAHPDNGRSAGPELDVGAIVGQRGKLVAEVVQTRNSAHIGDLCHGFFPQRPEVGERIVLGDGVLFVESVNGHEHVGLRPDDGRDHFWLDPPKLYRAHQQTVRLWFEKTEEA